MKIKIVFFVIIYIVFLASNLLAANYGSLYRLDKMENTVLKVDATYTGVGDVTLVDQTASGGSVQDIGGADPSAVVGNFFAGLNAPAGSITHLKPTFNSNMTFKGAVLYNGTYYYTSNNPIAQNYRTSASSDYTQWSDYTEVTFDLGSDITDTKVANITVPETGSIVVRFSFNLSSALLLSDEMGPLGLIPGEPDVTITQLQ